uniref:AAA+ ATPase domain-containing protein n=1 Tax=Glossina brevipalpis TaxID=37001 RepID=A0A1A9WZS4_9MUSC
MSPRSSNKKKTAVSWYHCDLCDVYLTSKERECHEQQCPISEDAFETPEGKPLEYIRNGFLYITSIQKKTFEIPELNDMPERYVNQMLFVSEGAMRLLSWHIGQQVAIQANVKNEAPLIRSLWPLPESFLTTVLVSEEDFSLYWSKSEGQIWQVYALAKGQPRIAKSVLLHLETPTHEHRLDDNDTLTLIELRDLKRLLKLELKNFCFTRGSRVHFNFFNKELLLRVTQWIDVVEDELLESALNKLSLENKNGEIVFKITNITTLEITTEERRLEIENEETNSKFKYMLRREDIGGLTAQLETVEETMDLALGLRKIAKGFRDLKLSLFSLFIGVEISRGLLLYGSSGCGKTMICEAMSYRLHDRLKDTTSKPLILKLSSSDIFSKYLGETEKNLYSYFQRVYSHYPSPSLMIVEDIHNLCPKHETAEVAKRLAIAFLNMLDALKTKREAQKCFVLATTSQIELLSPNLRRCGRLDCELEIPVPSPSGRAEILKCLLRKLENHKVAWKDVEEVAQITHGFVGSDLANLLYNASLRVVKRETATDIALTTEDLKAALRTVKPSAMREVLIECPNVTWADIGGQNEMKRELAKATEYPLKYAEEFKEMGIKSRGGILMYGPPGCSKTMIAKAIATESQLNFLSIKGPELFSMWVGESERAVREVFRKARQVAPAIVFFDEIDAIGSGRSEGSHGSSVKERVLTQLLTELDGVDTLENVTVVAATNRPDLIDRALIRPGRIGREIYVGLPDAQARKEIFDIKLQKMPLADDVDMVTLVNRTEGYSGAEIQAVCHEAALKALEDNFDAFHVSWSQFEYSLRLVQPRTSSELLRLYEEYKNKKF